MSNEFWIGFFYGALAAAGTLTALMTWSANQRVQQHLHSAIEAGARQGRTPGPCGVYPPPPAPLHPLDLPRSCSTCVNFNADEEARMLNQRVLGNMTYRCTLVNWLQSQAKRSDPDTAELLNDVALLVQMLNDDSKPQN